MWNNHITKTLPCINTQQTAAKTISKVQQPLTLSIDKNKQVLCDFEGGEYYRNSEKKSISAYFYNIDP
jgi:hypothetical protein